MSNNGEHPVTHLQSPINNVHESMYLWADYTSIPCLLFNVLLQIITLYK